MKIAGIDRQVHVSHMINHVAHMLFAWMILAIACGCGSDERKIDTKSENIPDRETIISATHIDDVFTLEREVVLTDSIYIAHYTYLDVDTDGNFLLTDMLGKQVFIFDRNGHHKKTLSTEPCDPGFPWHPYQARFNPEGNIIVNSSLWGYEFFNDGNCIGELSEEFGFPKVMGFNEKGHIYGFYVYGQEDKGYHIREMNRHGKPIREFGFGDKYYWYTRRNTPAPDIVVDQKGNIYHAKIFSSQIDKYDKEGNFITQIGEKPDDYREVQVNDSDFILDTDSRSSFTKYIGKFSLTRSLSLLNNKTIMLQYINEYNWDEKANEVTGLMFMDLEGNDLISTDMFTHIQFIKAKDGFAYSFYDSTNIGKGFALGSPSLKVYRYLPQSQ